MSDLGREVLQGQVERFRKRYYEWIDETARRVEAERRNTDRVCAELETVVAERDALKAVLESAEVSNYVMRSTKHMMERDALKAKLRQVLNWPLSEGTVADHALPAWLKEQAEALLADTEEKP